MPPLRHPAVAGTFYPHDAASLSSAVNSFLKTAPRKPALACIAPHASYIYSGHVAGAVFSALKIPPQVIILCPYLTGHGHQLSITSAGAWFSPLKEVPVT